MIARRHIVNIVYHGKYSGYGSRGQDNYVIVMDFVALSLRSVVGTGGRLLPDHALHLVRTLARAVWACHANPGDPIVHRDLSPANILLRECAPGDHGCCTICGAYYIPVLADFGLVRFPAAGPGGANHTTTRAGSDPYMAPEQFAPEGRALGDRLDVYALGVILFELLTGRPPIPPPHDQNTTKELPARLGSADLLPGSNTGQLADSVYRIYYHCLRKRAERRPRADQLADDIQNVIDSNEPRAPRVTGRMRTQDREEFQPELKQARWWLRRALQALTLLSPVLVLLVVALREARRATVAEEGQKTVAQQGRARLLLDAGMSQVRTGDPGFGALLIALSSAQAPPSDREYVTVVRRAVASARTSIHPLINILPGSGLVRAAPVWSPDPSKAGERMQPPFVLLPDNHGRVRFLSPLTGRPVADRTREAIVRADPNTSKTTQDLQQSLTAAAVSPDGQRFAVAAAGGSVLMFNAEQTGEPRWKISTSDPRGVAFAPVGGGLWVAGRGGPEQRLACYDAATGERRWSVPASTNLNAIAVSSDGRWVATGAPGAGRIEVWNASGGRPTTPAYSTTASGTVFCLAFNPADPRMLVSGDVTGDVRFWDVAAGREVGPAIRHDAAVRVTVFDPDGKWLLTGSEDKTAQVWHAESRLPAGQRFWHAAEVRAGALTRDRIITVDYRGEVRTWQFNPYGGDVVLRHPAQVRDAVIDLQGERVLTGCADGSSERGAARLWSITDGRHPLAILAHGAETLAVRFHPSNPAMAATADNTGRVCLWDIGRPAQPAVRADLHNPDGLVRSLAFGGPGDRYLAYAGARDTNTNTKPVGPFVYDLRTQKLAQLTHETYSFSWTVSFTPDKQFLVVDGGKAAGVWRHEAPADGWVKYRSDLQLVPAVAPTASGEPSDVLGSVVHPQKSLVLTWDEKQHAGIWDAAGGAPRHLSPAAQPAPAHAGKLTGAVFIPGVDMVATIAADGEMILWAAGARPTVKARIQHGSPVLAVAVSSDGKMLATGTQDGLVRLWSVSTGRWLGYFRAHHGPVTRITFSSRDNRTILSASHDWTARVFRIPVPEPEEGVAPATLVAQVEADTGITAILSEPNANVAFSPPRVLDRAEWAARRQLAGINEEE